jgi:beta-glucanase (GH16 family)
MHIMPANAAVVTCNATDIALNRPAAASSVQNSASLASNVVDGNAETLWSSASNDPQWLLIDLGSVQKICRVVLSWGAAYGKAYQIQVSNDAKTWTSIYSMGSGNGSIETLDVSGSGRYIRMYGSKRGTQSGYSLYEFRVYVSTNSLGQKNAIQPPSSQKLIWSDDFNGLAGKTPDASKWSPDVSGSGWGNNQREYDTNNKNAYLDGQGSLVLEARKENPANYQCWYGPCQYTSARINTSGHFSFTYGRVEARIKVPYGQGLWPAFWILGNNVGSVGWPNSGEMDIMENLGREPNTIHGTVHGPNYSGSNGIGGPDKLPRGRFADAYHIYAVTWDSSRISFSVDGLSYFTVTKATIESHGKWVFDHPFFIILNVAVGGFWPGDPNSSTVFPQKMYVDYVRVYQ